VRSEGRCREEWDRASVRGRDAFNERGEEGAAREDSWRGSQGKDMGRILFEMFALDGQQEEGKLEGKKRGGVHADRH